MGSSKVMRLLFIIDNLGSGGAQIQILNLASKLADKSYSITVHIYASNDQSQFWKDEFSRKGIQLIYNSKKPGFQLSVIRNIKKTLNQQSFDCVISVLPNANFYMALTNLFSFKKIPHISWEMSIHSKYTNFTTKFISVFSNFFSNAIICNSQTQKKLFQNFYLKKENAISFQMVFLLPSLQIITRKEKYAIDIVSL